MAAPDALVAFCCREHPRLVGTLSLFCGDAAVAEELAQEALYRACRDWAKVSTMPAPGAWVHRVAINLANSTHRRRRVERRAIQTNQAIHRHENVTSDPGTAIAVRQAVAALPPRQRAAVALRHFAGYSVAETAELLGVSEGAVKQLTHRAAATLRDRLSDDDTLSEAPDAR
jgi:RNA polymerase sigma-70 factor (ECF subfamily)